MPISVTCDCGSRLEIDEKFLGKEIPCPDCGKPLPTKAPPAPPPLELHDNRRTSGLAVAALAVGIVGFFTVIGSLVAIGLGLLSVRMLAKSRRLEGAGLARAAIAVGGAGILCTIVMLITPLGLDFFFRDFAYLTRSPMYENSTKIEGRAPDVSVKRPEKSGPWAKLGQPSQIASPDKLLAVFVRGDAFISCVRASRDLQEPDDEKEKEKDWRAKVLERVRKSELVAMLSTMNGPPVGEGTVVDAKKSDDGVHEVKLNMRFGRVDRTFLILYRVQQQHRTKIDVFIGCCRSSNFERLEEEFRDSFKGFTAD